MYSLSLSLSLSLSSTKISHVPSWNYLSLSLARARARARKIDRVSDESRDRRQQVDRKTSESECSSTEHLFTANKWTYRWRLTAETRKGGERVESGALIESVKRWKNIGGPGQRKMNALEQWVRATLLFSLSLSLSLSFLARWHLIFRTSTLIWLILLLSASNIRDREKGRESRRFLRILLFAVKLLERNLPSVLQLPDGFPSRFPCELPLRYFKGDTRVIL